ncbi:MAG: hypothetical protein IMZ66_03155, partial [Planctomycetes bacterium]|nr:hypothetical protein [Planctomycetota bacterium]
AAASRAAAGRDIRDRLGVTHVNGQYHLTDKPFLAEGADAILALGSRVIKLYLFQPEKNYPFNTAWPAMASPAEAARAAPMREVFARPFTTYILTVYAAGRPEHYWREGVTPDQVADETRQFHDLALHLLTAYRGTGKTFVLQHWEGDWAARGSFDPKAPLTPRAAAGMIAWLRARQAGVEKARAEAGEQGVHVYHAAEVNLVVQAMRDGRPGVADRVLPEARCDLASYSAWDAGADARTLREALDFIARHQGGGGPFGDRAVYVGEFGLPETDAGPEKVRATVRTVIETARDWGCPWIVYWQVYCNEARRRPVATNADVRGFWLLRPDGTRGAAWDVLAGLLTGPG